MLRRVIRCLFFFLLGGLFYACQLSSSSLFSLLPANETGIAFSNRMPEKDTLSILDIDYFYNGGGVAIGDFNNDSLQDVYFTGNLVANKLYLNKGDFKFTDVSDQAGVGGGGKWCSGVALVDINNDGLLDIYVGATIRKAARDRENLLYVNQGWKGQKDGVPVFKEMAKEYGIADNGYTTNAAFFDYDNDGDLDLFVLTNMAEKYPAAYRKKVMDGSSPTTDRLYRNDFDPNLGHPVFTDVSKEAGIVLEGYGLGLNICDINRDGWKDIYITNDFLTEDHFFINNQNGGFNKPGFTDRAGAFFKHTSSAAMGNDVADLNNDGLMDIVVLDMLPGDNQRKKMFIPPNNYQAYLNNEEFQYQHQYMRNTLQLNQGFRPGTREPVFSEISLMAGVAATDWSWTPLAVDFDHDGFRDIVVTNGFPKDITDRDFMMYYANNSSVATKEFMLSQIPVIKINNYAFKNNGNLTFSDVSREWGVQTPAFSGGAAYGDLDNDGDLDMVINNINDSAFVYRNNLVEQKPQQANYLRIRFKGSEQNRTGLGAFVELKYGKGQQQVYEHTIYRGYLSTVENAAHFGLGAATTIDEVRISWPAQNGKPGKAQTLRNVRANQVLTVDLKNATEPAVLPPTPPAGTLFRDITDSLQVRLVHQEPEYIDFDQQKLLPHKLSQYGPAVAVGDVNGDGLDDLFIGGSRTQKGRFLIQTAAGKLVEQDLLPGAAGEAKPEEDMGTLLFDADGDGDLDLYIASGGFEGEPNSAAYQDRFYLNDGKGRFALAAQALPQNHTSKSCVKAADYDRDGDLDLFVGGRVVPHQYPRPVTSVILRNDSRPGQPKFTDVTKTVAPELQNIGLVCDALWTDTDNDGWPDLMLAGEWMPLTILKNTKGNLLVDKRDGVPAQTLKLAGSETVPAGWWNSLVAADFDRDGDMDYVAGNLGLNTLAQASEAEPVRVYAKDFDNNGFYDAIPTVFFPDAEGKRWEYPFNGREEMIRQIISMRARFPLNKDFSMATVDKLLKEEELKDAIVLKANYMKSAYVENKGDGRFEVHDLPIQAQTAPVFGMLADDFDHDGNPDVLLVGNDFGSELQVGRLDALNGLLLKGDGKGGFTALNPAASGFYVPGNAKGVVRLSAGTRGASWIVATQNRGPLKVFRWAAQPQTVRLKPTDVTASLVYANGKKQKLEFYYGQSFLSQSAREITIGSGVKSLEVIDSKGAKRMVSLQPLAGK